MRQNPYQSCLNSPIESSLPFYNGHVSLNICAHVLAWSYPSNPFETHCFSTHNITLACQLLSPTLLSHCLCSSALSPPSLSPSLTRFNPRCGFLKYIFV
ncbi:unnamed protein product [Hymenolepis diminuta]|uniref:Uncharacterized protein n=1 Tax=Hymenolepis diminuta TaxID=6216 RepID=A0A564XWR5_HYMDI|nr:unnamed protein product [Hymenolepis diminuta]